MLSRVSRATMSHIKDFRAISSVSHSAPKPWGAKSEQWVIADVCVTPMGVGTGVSQYVSEVEKVLREFPGVTTKLHAYGTNIEGEWDDVMAAIKATHERMHQIGAPRVSSNMRFGTRIDKKQRMQDKVDVVEQILRE